MLDDDFAKRLDGSPAPEDVVSQLFEVAREKSEARTFLAVIDFEVMVHDGKSYNICENMRYDIVQQFDEYFMRVLQSHGEFANIADANVSRRLQMLAYSQFWECLGIQRLLTQLVGIARGEQYQPRLMLDKRHMSSYQVFKNIRDLCRLEELHLDKFLEAVYSNQIRNAFSHSEIWMLLDYVTFQNYDSSNPNHVTSLKFETWKRLFKVTSDFIIALFKERRELEVELESNMPYRVDLPEFAGPFSLSKDGLGHWST